LAQTRDSEPTIAQLEARVKGGDSLDAETQFRLGQQYDRAKRYDDEERALRTAIASDPRYAPAYLWLSYLPYDRRPQLWKERWKGKVPEEWRKPLRESGKLARQAFLIDPFVDFRVVGAKPIPQDLVTLPEYKGYEKYTTFVLGWLGIAGFNAERYELSFSAMDLYKDRAFSGKPDDSIPSWVFIYHGLSAAHLNALDKATADFDVLYRRGQKVEESDSLVQIPLEANDFRYTLAVLKERYHRPADALKLYQDAITVDLGLYMAHAHMAQLYRQYKMWDKAAAEAQAAVDANPEDASLDRDLAAVLQEAGKLPQAEEALKHAQDVDPRLPLVSYDLGLLEQQLNKPADARAAFTRFVAIAPSRLATQVADAKQRLASLP
jgi:tetratricopeptide (TPR) repeat protein